MTRLRHQIKLYCIMRLANLKLYTVLALQMKYIAVLKPAICRANVHVRPQPCQPANPRLDHRLGNE
jgi:hypothetical protein